MRSGPKAIQYQGTLFRVSELVWVKVRPLSWWKVAIKLALIGLGIAFFYLVGTAKGSFWNVEGILGFLAVHIGYCMRGDTRLATSGDLVESYDARGVEGERRTFGQWVQALGDGPNECKLGQPDGPYHYWLNLDRVAWARPSFTYDFYGLTAIPVYLAYDWLISKNLKLTLSDLLHDLNLLQFENGSGDVSLCCWAIAGAGLLAALSSVARVVEVRACGGLSDTFAVTGKDMRKFFAKMAGLGEAATESKAPVAPSSNSSKSGELAAPEPAPVEEPASTPVAAVNS